MYCVYCIVCIVCISTWAPGGGDLRRKTSGIPIEILMKISKNPTLATLCLGKYVCDATLMIFMWFDSEAEHTELGARLEAQGADANVFDVVATRPRVGGMGRISLIAVWAMPIQWLHLECAVAAWQVRCRSRPVSLPYFSIFGPMRLWS